MNPKGKSGFSQFFEDAQNNTNATILRYGKAYRLLKDISDVFEKLSEYLYNSPQFFSGFFVLRAHASYLGAIRLTISGQVPEAYMVLRGCLENAIYGFYFFKNPQSRQVWLSRHDDEASRRTVKTQFQITRLTECLKSASEDIYRVAKELYDRTIDYGAHPNERALTHALIQRKTEEGVEYFVKYLFDDCKDFRGCLLTNAQIGVCALDIFREVFRERYDILGISEEMGTLRERAVNLFKNSKRRGLIYL